MKRYHVLGLMSGTSLDGLDIAHCELWQDVTWNFKIHETATYRYNETWQKRLKSAIHLDSESHMQLHLDYGEWLGKQCRSFIESKGIQIDFISSHGHTSHHRPEQGITFQLGDGQTLADSGRETVICDYRTTDVALGGQGAPLAPIGDHFLFSEYDFCLNLGGISNISYLKNNQRIAFDSGLANMPLNHLSQKLGKPYDMDGKLAQSGKLNLPLLQELNALDYYSIPPPKSTGLEWFTEQVLPIITTSKASVTDKLNTLVHHNCEQIASAIKQTQSSKNAKVLVTGGGAFNSFFMTVLQEKLENIATIVLPDSQVIDFKEALIFAFLGVLKSKNEVNVLKSVTGATKDSCSGHIFYPR